MLPQFFLKTKLVPPRLGRRILPRPRLVDRIRGFVDQPATIVCADAGCGKTTLVGEFVRGSGLPFVWYQIDPTDVDLAVFFGYLVYAIRSLHPEFGQVVLGFISETENLASKTEQLIDVFVNEVSEHIEQKTIVVLDDYHHVDSSEAIAGCTDRLVQFLPDVLHIVITSRTMPNLSVTRLRSKGLIGVVDRKDLLFTPSEVQKLFAETFHHPLAADQVDQFYEKTDGWVTALQLIQQSLDHASDRVAAGVTSARKDWLSSAFQQSELDIFDYFAEEVLQSESPETRVMLAKISLLERIDPVICEVALGIQKCSDQLRALGRRNVFISQTYASGPDEEYRLHPLFRSFLNRWLVSNLGSEEITRLHKECAAYLARAERWDLAAHHLAEAGAADEVATLLAEHGAELVASGRLETIKRTFDGLSEESLAGRPRALIARADVALIEGDHARALGLYAQAARTSRAGGDSSVEAEALRGQAYIARYGNDCETAIKLATSAIELAPTLHALRARCYNTIGLCSFTSPGGAQRAIENWQAALEEAREARDDRFARIALHNLGLPYSMEGDFNEALHWLTQMIDGRSASESTGSAEDQVPFPQEAIAHLNIARLKIVQGKLDEAQSHLELALARCQLFNLRSAAAETLEAYGSLYRERGDYNRSLEFFDEAVRAYREAGVLVTDRELLDERATLYLRMGDTTAAANDADEYFRARAGGSPDERSSALITRGRIQSAIGRVAEAESALSEAATLAHENKLRYNEARALLALALLLWNNNRHDEALAHFSRAVEISIRYDYAYLLSTKAAVIPQLFRAAIRAGISPDYLAPFVPAEEIELAAAAVAGAAVSAAPAIATVIERPSYDLAINMLGPVEVFRDPSGMTKEVWRLSKALHILCYLCSRRNHRAPKETLVEMFWSDADEDTVAKNFHPTISHLRKALNTGQVMKKDFVLYREGAYLLNPQYRYRLDTEEFERLLAEAREARRSGNVEASAQLLADAIKLYRGDFLEEFYYNWIEELQSYYRDLYLEALKESISHHSERGDHEIVIRYGQMFLARDPYQEEVHSSVMEAYVRSGNRAAAIEQFDSLRKLLRRELGVDPLPATIAKYEGLIK